MKTKSTLANELLKPSGNLLEMDRALMGHVSEDSKKMGEESTDPLKWLNETESPKESQICTLQSCNKA